MSALLSTPARGSQLDGLRSALAARGSIESSRRADAAGPTVLVCASGRGGSGTSLTSALLALAAAGDGHRTLLVDGDELVGPHALLLGVSPRLRWPALLGGATQASQLPLTISDTLSFVAGGRGDSVTDVSPLSAAERRACFARLHTLADSYALMVIDAGSRLDAVLAAIDSSRANVRLVVVTAGQDPIAMASSYALLKAVHARQPRLDIDVLVNRLDDSTASRVADTLAQGAQQFLGRSLSFAGALPNDFALDAALLAGMPFLDAVTGSPVAVAAHDTVLRMVPAVSTTRSGV
jgi:flagellar biosynthesis protein FlhG